MHMHMHMKWRQVQLVLPEFYVLYCYDWFQLQLLYIAAVFTTKLQTGNLVCV